MAHCQQPSPDQQGIPHYKIIISSHYDFYFEMPNKNHMVARPSRIRAKNNYMVTWPSRFRRKIIIVWHCPAGSPEKNYSVALASRPSTRIPSQNGGALRFPLWGTCQKIIWQPHWENYMAASGLLLTKNNYSVALASRTLRKKS